MGFVHELNSVDANDDIYMFEGQESVNILQLVVPTIRKLSSTKFTFVMNCIFISYKVKNILQAQKYLSNQVLKIFPFHI
jgi:hypothetical protein